MTHNERLKLWRAYCAEVSECHSTERRAPAFPEALRDMTCGAKTKAGTPCKQKGIFENGRCKWHGGQSTGPITEAGKEQARINGRKGGRPRKDGMAR